MSSANNVDSGLIRQSDETCTKKSDLLIFEMEESNSTDGGEEAIVSTQTSLSQLSDTESHLENVVQNDMLMDMDQVLFKTPLKRKKVTRAWFSKQVRKNHEEEKLDNESSEIECSDLNVSVCFQSNWSCLDYGVEEIKKFLKVKNMRGVQIVEYFPELRRLLENIKCFMSEGRLTDKEVNRLKKIVIKIQLQLSNDDEMV